MLHKNMIKNPLIIVSLTIIIMFFISLLPNDIEIFGIQLRYVDIFSDLKENAEEDEYYYEEYDSDMDYFHDEQDSDSSSDGAFLNTNEYNIKYAFASISFFENAKELTSKFIEAEVDNIDAFLATSKIQMKKEKITGNTKQLKYFFNELKKAKTKKIRVAHYGDSAIEGDLVTADLRENLQTRFGGNGVGFVSITSQDIQFRQTTKHSFSNGWESGTLYSKNPKKLLLGISGEAFVPGANSWVQYETTRRYKYLKPIGVARLLYSNTKRLTINYSFNKGPSKIARLSSGSKIQELELKPPGGKAQKLRIEIPASKQANFYGTLLETGNGVYVDNFPLRGNSGVDIQHLSKDVLKEFGRLLNYKLIILQFGLNAAGSAKSNYSWYEREMIMVINNLKEAFPETSFLMISVHDKSMKRGSRFVTDPSILKLLRAQINIAKKTKIAFWNLFEAMGGRDSMPKWVSANPPLAFRDYIHFNDQGAKKVADLLSETLIETYNKY